MSFLFLEGLGLLGVFEGLALLLGQEDLVELFLLALKVFLQLRILRLLRFHLLSLQGLCCALLFIIIFAARVSITLIFSLFASIFGGLLFGSILLSVFNLLVFFLFFALIVFTFHYVDLFLSIRNVALFAVINKW